MRSYGDSCQLQGRAREGLVSQPSCNPVAQSSGDTNPSQRPLPLIDNSDNMATAAITPPVIPSQHICTHAVTMSQRPGRWALTASRTLSLSHSLSSQVLHTYSPPQTDLSTSAARLPQQATARPPVLHTQGSCAPAACPIFNARAHTHAPQLHAIPHVQPSLP